jgi:hypothetical protein
LTGHQRDLELERDLSRFADAGRRPGDVELDLADLDLASLHLEVAPVERHPEAPSKGPVGATERLLRRLRHVGREPLHARVALKREDLRLRVDLEARVRPDHGVRRVDEGEVPVTDPELREGDRPAPDRRHERLPEARELHPEYELLRAGSLPSL